MSAEQEEKGNGVVFYTKNLEINGKPNDVERQDLHLLFVNKKDAEGVKTEWPQYDGDCEVFSAETLEKEKNNWKKTGKSYPLLAFGEVAYDIKTVNYDEYIDKNGDRFILTPLIDKKGSYIQRKVKPLKLKQSLKNPDEMVLDTWNGGIGLLWEEHEPGYLHIRTDRANEARKEVFDYIKNVFSKKTTENQSSGKTQISKEFLNKSQSLLFNR